MVWPVRPPRPPGSKERRRGCHCLITARPACWAGLGRLTRQRRHRRRHRRRQIASLTPAPSGDQPPSLSGSQVRPGLPEGQGPQSCRLSGLGGAAQQLLGPGSLACSQVPRGRAAPRRAWGATRGCPAGKGASAPEGSPRGRGEDAPSLRQALNSGVSGANWAAPALLPLQGQDGPKPAASLSCCWDLKQQERQQGPLGTALARGRLGAVLTPVELTFSSFSSASTSRKCCHRGEGRGCSRGSRLPAPLTLGEGRGARKQATGDPEPPRQSLHCSLAADCPTLSHLIFL